MNDILQLWSHEGVVSYFPDPWHLCFDIAFQKAQGFIGVTSNPVYVEVPGETTRNIKPHVFGTGDCLENMTVESVWDY